MSINHCGVELLPYCGLPHPFSPKKKNKQQKKKKEKVDILPCAFPYRGNCSRT
jgi:hypothetical protein